MKQYPLGWLPRDVDYFIYTFATESLWWAFKI